MQAEAERKKRAQVLESEGNSPWFEVDCAGNKEEHAFLYHIGYTYLHFRVKAYTEQYTKFTAFILS